MAPSSTPDGRGSSDSATTTRCPLLISHLETRNPQRRVAILDTARASRRSLAAYAGLTGRFVFLGVADDLDPDDERVLPVLDDGLQRYGGRSLDLMLLWDLPNFLDVERLGELASLLRGHLRPGGRVHMLVASSQRHVGPEPAQFEVLPGWAGVVVEAGEPVRGAPRFTPWQIEQSFAGYEIERSVLLRSGMQEYLLRLRMSATPSPEGS